MPGNKRSKESRSTFTWSVVLLADVPPTQAPSNNTPYGSQAEVTRNVKLSAFEELNVPFNIPVENDGVSVVQSEALTVSPFAK